MKHIFTISLCFLALSLSFNVFGQGMIVDTLYTEDLACEGDSYKLFWSPFQDQITEVDWLNSLQNFLDQSVYSGVTLVEAVRADLMSTNCWSWQDPEYFPNESFSIGCNSCSGAAVRAFVDFIVISYPSNPCSFLSEELQNKVCRGCLDANALNFNPTAIIDGEQCIYSSQTCGQGTIWDEETQTCIVAIPTDSNFDGCTDLNDLMDILANYGDCGAGEAPWQCGAPLEYQGYEYETVQIGDQCWFAENLRADSYSNGEQIQSSVSGAWYNGTLPLVEFGSLISGNYYNYYAAIDPRGVCPNSWLVASDEDWQILESSAGMLEVDLNEFGWRGTDVGEILKASIDDNPTWNGINALGFSAQPGGVYFTAPLSGITGEGTIGMYWTRSAGPEFPEFSIIRSFHSSYSSVERKYHFNGYGFSIRCIKT